MKTRISSLGAVCLLILLIVAATVNGQDINGVFGLAPVTEDAALAVWVPLDSGEAISGVKWFNNDGTKVFPELLAVAGDAAYPSLLNDAVQVGTDVTGGTLGWSELTFQQALASATPGLFLVFKLPADGAFVSEGDGCGLGYQLGDGLIRCWVSTEPGEWSQLSPEFQMAVTPVMNTNKSGEVLVLGAMDRAPRVGEKPPVVIAADLQVAPNPFNPRTTITYALPADRGVVLAVYDVRGRKVATLFTGPQAAGSHAVTWDGRNDSGVPMPSGVYLAQLRSGSLCMTRRMTLVQ